MPLPLYYDSLDTARRQDDVMLWRNSFKENIRCKNAIEKALAENFDGMHLKDGIIPPLAEEYGTDRLTWVLANTVKEHMDDGRFRPANKEWADGIYIPKGRRNYEFSVGSHPEIVNGLITDYRQYLSDVLHQYGVGDCLPGSNHDNYEHQLLILNPFLLHEDYKHGDYQLFYATSGNGCDESNIGRKVFGRFLKDDEHTHFYRDEFLGIADESKLPEWAVTRLNELRAAEGTEDFLPEPPRTITILDQFGNEQKLIPRLELYSVQDYAGNEKYGLAIVLDAVNDIPEETEPYAVLTVSFGDFIGAKDCAYIDRNNCPFADQLLDLGIAESTPFDRKSGFCTYPLWHFHKDFLRDIGAENYEKYVASFQQEEEDFDEEDIADDEDEGMVLS